MDLDPNAARLLRMLGTGSQAGIGRMTIEERRRSFDAMMRLARAGPAMRVEDHAVSGNAGGLSMRLFRPGTIEAPLAPGLIYFHGGGLVAGSCDSYEGVLRHLAQDAGCLVAAVEYRLAPEHPYPAAIEDALEATRHLFDHAVDLGIDRDRIAVGGDSGGGTLAAVATQVLRQEAAYQARCQVLLCPVLDFVDVWPSRSSFARGYLLDAALMRRDLDDYAPGRSLEDPRISPLRAADLSGLPPALIYTAGFDPLRDEGAAYARRLAEAGTRVSHTCFESMVHHFYALAGLIPAARPMLQRIGADIARELGHTPVRA